jgi:hypothetical protein
MQLSAFFGSLGVNRFRQGINNLSMKQLASRWSRPLGPCCKIFIHNLRIVMVQPNTCFSTQSDDNISGLRKVSEQLWKNHQLSNNQHTSGPSHFVQRLWRFSGSRVVEVHNPICNICIQHSQVDGGVLSNEFVDYNVIILQLCVLAHRFTAGLDSAHAPLAPIETHSH